MRITVTGKHMNIGESFRQYIESNLTRLTEKYLSHPLEAHITMSKEEGCLKADIRLHLSKGTLVQAHFEGHEPYPTFDQALSKIEGRLRRYKGKLRDHHKKDHEAFPAFHYIIERSGDSEESEAAKPLVIAEMPTEILTLSVSEAVMHMDLVDAPALIFYNRAHKGLSVIYRRADGNIGWVDPKIAEPAQESASPVNGKIDLV